MDLHVRDCLVENFEDIIPALHLPDPKDRHVLAAAIRGRADVIVTYNLKDFPEKELQKYGIGPSTPMNFSHICSIWLRARSARQPRRPEKDFAIEARQLTSTLKLWSGRR